MFLKILYYFNVICGVLNVMLMLIHLSGGAVGPAMVDALVGGLNFYAVYLFSRRQ